jgi:hypothetical protein
VTSTFRALAALAVTGSALALAACGIQSTAAGVCPKIGVLPDAADFPVRNANGDIVALGRLSLSNTSCIYDKSRVVETGFSSVSFTLTVTASVVRSEGARLSSVDLPYVVATVAPDGVITGRQESVLEVSLDGRSGQDEDRLNIRIPYRGNADADQHRVVAAFRVDEQTVLLNRNRLGR